MAIDIPQPDTARSIQHEADQSWPNLVKIQLHWVDKLGRPLIRSQIISADQFFGHGSYGAPLSGDHLIGAIERMRRQGPPSRNKQGKKIR